MKTYLITGCAGFIGSNFVHYMLKKYPEILLVNLDKLTYAGNLENLKDVEGDPRHVFVQGDICDKELVESLFAKYDFASEIIRLSGVDAAVAPCTSEEYKAKHPESADRPKWSALDNRMLRCTVGNDVRDWRDALACFFAHWDGDNGMKD